MHSAFLGSSFVAVRVGDAWQFFSPAETYTPYGMLGWPEEGQDVLVTDAKEPVWVRSPVAGPEKSVERRTARLKLSEDGTLEGDVRIEYTGHLAFAQKEYNDDDSPAEREKTLVEAWKTQMGAEVTNLVIENVNDPVKPFVYAFHVRVPGYATRTGKRLFLQPAFFQKGLAPRFPVATRRHEVYFHHTWSEEDTVEITLPEGFALDNAEAPGALSGGPLSRYEPAAGVTPGRAHARLHAQVLLRQGRQHAPLPRRLLPDAQDLLRRGEQARRTHHRPQAGRDGRQVRQMMNAE